MDKRTWIDPEEVAYSYWGKQSRKGRAVFPDGKIRAFRAGIPDTYFSIPAHARIRGKYVPGFIMSNDDGDLTFNVMLKDRARFMDAAQWDGFLREYPKPIYQDIPKGGR